MKTSIFIIIFAVGLAFLLDYGMDKQARITCLGLQEQSERYAPHFFLSEDAKEWCDNLGIIINAPVGY